MSDSSIRYAFCDDTCMIKLSGKISYPSISSFDNFVNWMFERGEYTEIIIDMCDASYIDSTNLGALVKIASTYNSSAGKKAAIISNNETITTILKNIGLNEVFNLMSSPISNFTELENMPNISNSELDDARMVFEAHKRLMELNEKNQETFKNVVEVMEKQLESSEEAQ